VLLQLVEQHRGQVDLATLAGVRLRLLDGQDPARQVDRAPPQRAQLGHAQTGEDQRREQRPMPPGVIEEAADLVELEPCPARLRCLEPPLAPACGVRRDKSRVDGVVEHLGQDLDRLVDRVIRQRGRPPSASLRIRVLPPLEGSPQPHLRVIEGGGGE
jgi:hypothetical protein